jgi:hypothetical protein
MIAEDHPKFTQWSVAFDRRHEAERRYKRAQRDKDPAVAEYKLDFDKANADYEAICKELE